MAIAVSDQKKSLICSLVPAYIRLIFSLYLAHILRTFRSSSAYIQLIFSTSFILSLSFIQLILIVVVSMTIIITVINIKIDILIMTIIIIVINIVIIIVIMTISSPLFDRIF